MSTSRLLSSRSARWAVPVGLVALIAAGVGVGTSAAGASPGLPPRSAADLLASAAQAAQQPFSGTVTETANLGIPDVPGADSSDLSLPSLLTGSHTARVWYAGPSQVRIAMVTDLAETDLIRDGSDVWVWSSAQQTAGHAVLPAAAGRPATALPVDPMTAATQALAAIDPSTAVTVDGTSSVAGRAAYELVLSPRSSSSLIAQVRIALDAQNSVPLRVEVFAKGGTDPAFETGFTAVQFARPADSVFAFSPPAGTKVTQLSGAHPARDGTEATPKGSAPKVHGSGWDTVVEVDDLAALTADADGNDPTSSTLGALLGSATTVSGRFGTGKLVRTPLLTALLLPDGRVFAGAVEPGLVEAAAAAAATSG